MIVFPGIVFLCSWAVGNSNWDSVKLAYYFGIISGNADCSGMYWEERGKGKDGKLGFLLMVLGELYVSVDVGKDRR